MTITIHSAIYGVDGRHIDVTERVKLMVRGFNRSIFISNDTVGPDPAVGHVKQLHVTYSGHDGHIKTIEGKEGSTIVLIDEQQGQPGLPQWPI